MIFFSKNIKYIREKKGLNQLEIASSAGFKKAQWSSWETENSYPKFLDFVKLSLFLDISETDLIHKDLSENFVNNTFKKNIEENQNEMLQTLQDLIKLQREKINDLEKENSELRKQTQQFNIAAEPNNKYNK